MRRLIKVPESLLTRVGKRFVYVVAIASIKYVEKKLGNIHLSELNFIES